MDEDAFPIHLLLKILLFCALSNFREYMSVTCLGINGGSTLLSGLDSGFILDLCCIWWTRQNSITTIIQSTKEPKWPCTARSLSFHDSSFFPWKHYYYINITFFLSTQERRRFRDNSKVHEKEVFPSCHQKIVAETNKSPVKANTWKIGFAKRKLCEWCQNERKMAKN